MSTFHNPYHFVPVKSAHRVDDLEVSSFPDNRGHVTHDRYCPGTYSGRIICRLTTETPIFVGSKRTKEASNEGPAEVNPFELDNKSALPASTLRGLLSSVAETASNSALRILDDAKYSYRRLMDPKQTLSAIGMVIVRRDDEGNPEYLVRPLTLPLMEFKGGQPAMLEPHWRALYREPNLRVYIGDKYSIRDAKFAYQTFSSQHERYYGMKLRRRSWDNDVQGVLARDDDQYIKAGRFLVAQQPMEDGNPKRRNFQPRLWEEIPDEEKPLYTRGILRVLGCSPDRGDIPDTKKHELFIPYPAEAENWEPFPIRNEAVERFHDLADQRTKASEGNPSPWPYEPRGTERNDNPEKYGNKFRLKNGDLVWFRPELRAGVIEIAEVSLSSIWRGRVETNDNRAATTRTFFGKIDGNLLPFNSARTMITVAEQLFGFVDSTKGEATGSARALAGRVYFSHAHIEGFTNPSNTDWAAGNRGLDSPYLEAVTLKILDSPKPPSPCLYFKKATGSPGYIAKRELKAGQHHPQGRKYYLHHRNRELNEAGMEPWRSLNTDRPQQKVRITPLKAHAMFYFHIDFDNLSAHELGLLLFALKPDEEFRHKIGMGKPLGLGRVNIEPVGFFRVDRYNRYTSDALFGPRYAEAWAAEGEDRNSWPARYEREKETEGVAAAVSNLRDAFISTMDPDIRAALLQIGNPQAVRAPVHTPLTRDGDSEDETFRWFVVNDKRATAKDPGKKPAFLAPLPDSSGQLPVLPSHQQEE
jgi:CRISPR-associated protein (TIGR03986 family)